MKYELSNGLTVADADFSSDKNRAKVLIWFDKRIAALEGQKAGKGKTAKDHQEANEIELDLDL